MKCVSTPNNKAGAVWPLPTVHKTVSHNQQTAIENIDAISLLLFVHLNEFSWTRRAMCGREA